eukprot:1916618-Karenia_brevis.AAC.1
MQLPRAHGSTEKPTPQDQVLSIICGGVAHGAWDSRRARQKRISDGSTGGGPKPCVPHDHT